MPRHLQHTLRILVWACAPCIAACSRASPRADSAEALLAKLPPTKRIEHFRRDSGGQPQLTLTIGVRAEKTRWILSQQPMDEGEMTIVADSAGLIPVFESDSAARAYARRTFPLDTANAGDAAAVAYARVLDQGGPMVVDLDRVRSWATNLRSPHPGPIELALTWEMLAAADAAPPIATFDAMGMGAIAQQVRGKTLDSASAQVILLGMKLNGIADEIRRKDPNPDPPWPTNSGAVWTPDDDALLAALLRRGIPNFTARLSEDAAQRDVTATWSRPKRRSGNSR